MKIRHSIKAGSFLGLILLFSIFSQGFAAVQAVTITPAAVTKTATVIQPTATLVKPTATRQPTATSIPATATGHPTPTPVGTVSASPTGILPTATATSVSPVTSGTTEFKLAELTGIGDIVLQGASPSYSFFVPIPPEWKLNGLTTHLEVSQSNMLRPDSSITMEVNGIPISSLRLDSASQTSEIWTVTIPAELLTVESLNFSFTASLRITDKICDDIQNSANWVTISNKSIVEFHHATNDISLQFNQFPYPIIRNRSLTADQVAVVFSPDANSEVMSSVFGISSYLGTQSTWRGLNLLAVPVDELTDTIARKSDLVLVGTESEIEKWLNVVKWPLQVGTGGNLLLPDEKPVPDDTGVLMMTVSPGNPSRAILAITGKTPAAVNKAAEAIRHSQFANLSRGEYAVIPNSPIDLTADKAEPNWANVSLAALNYEDQPVYGVGKQRISIPINLPGSLNPQDMKVHLVFSHAPFVSTDRSYLVLSANGIPQSGLYLDAKNEHQYKWDVTIPASKLVPGKNILEVLFDLHLSDNEVCDEFYLDKAWGVLHKESSIQVTFSTDPPTPNLFTYPQPFGKNALVVVSSQMGEKERAGTFQLVSQLGKSLGNQARFIKIMTDSQVTEESLAGHDLILIGKPDTNPWVNKAIQSAPIQFDNNTRTLKTSLFDLSILDDQVLGLLQEIVSPWDKARTVLLITGTTDDSVAWAGGLLSNPALGLKLKGDIALVDAGGTLTVMNSQVPETLPVSASAQTATEEKGFSEKILWIVLIAVIAILAIGLLVTLIRRRTAAH